MLGTLVNVGAVLLGSLLGCLLKKGLPERLRTVMMQGLGLCVLLIGIKGATQTPDMMGVILSMVIGALIGVALRIEQRLDGLGKALEKKLDKSGSSDVGKGFVTASLIFCVGAMAIVGAMDSGLRGDHSTLLAKSLLDGVTSLILASTLGAGVALSAVSVLVYQGAIVLLSRVVSPYLTEAVIAQMSAVGGLLIVGIGYNMLTDKHLAVGDLLPAIFLPILLTPLLG